MKKDYYSILKETFFASTVAAILIGLYDALYLFINIGDYSDLYVFRYAAVSYGIFGLISAIGISAFWLIFNVFRKIPTGRVYCYTLTFILGCGLYATIDYIIVRVIGLDNPIPTKRIGMAIIGPIFAITIGSLLYKLNKMWRFKLSGHRYNLAILSVLLIVPIVSGTISKPVQQYTIKYPISKTQSTEQSDVILIIADALRADYLSLYGGNIPVPALESLAEDGITFSRAFSQCSWTRPAFASILTSLYPTQHNTRKSLTGKFNGGKISLQKFLGEMGFVTAGFFNNANLAPAFNFQMDFDEYFYTHPEEKTIPPGSANYLRLRQRVLKYWKRLAKDYYTPSQYYRPAEELITLAENWIDKYKNGNFFILLHIMEPHIPYFAHPLDGKGFGYSENPFAGKVEILSWKDIYRQEIMHMDTILTGFLDYLKENRLYESSLIIFTADHGEEFYDHEHMNHGTTLYNEVLRVPLIIKLPNNGRKGEKISRLASLVDIPPIISSILRFERPDGWMGRNPLLPAEENEFTIANLKRGDNETHSIIQGDYKLIKNLFSINKKQIFELYRLTTDSSELINIAERYPEVVEALDKSLDSILHITIPINIEDSIKIDITTLERLKAMGYVE